MRTLLQRKGALGVLAGLAAALIALLLGLSPALRGWENVTWSWRVRSLARPAPATANIKVILIDQASLDWGASVNGWTWPWPREIYSYILDFLARAGVKAVAFDMLYLEPSMYDAYDDVTFGDAAARSGNFVAAVFMGTQAGQAAQWPGHLSRPPLTVDGMDERIPVEPRATFPVPPLATAAAMLANVRDVPDADGVFRRVAPLRVFDGSPLPLLGFAAYLAGSGTAPHNMVMEKGVLRIDDRLMPLDRRGQVLLRFRGPSGTHESISAAAVLQSEARILDGEVPLIDPAELRGTYVLLGPSAPGLKDTRSTPVSGDYPGVELHATFLDNLLENDFIRETPRNWVVVTVLLLALAAGVTMVCSRGVAGGLGWAAIWLVAPVAIGFAVYPMGWWWPVMIHEVAALAAIGIGLTVNYATEGRQKRFIKSAFQQYLSGDVIERILEDPGQLKLGGEKRELTILFSDLQGFSGISEKLGPEALTALLNDYLTDMSDIIMEEGGTVDKYEGDAIIAFWNAPLPQADHAARACRAALRCQRKLAERRAEFLARTGASMFMRIGIHTGDVVVGNMGSRNRFNYTVLGDAANLASRLEGANKPFGTYLMVSEVTWKQARESVTGREIGAITVVGRKTPVTVFELFGFASESASPLLAPWNEAMLLVRAGRWAEAHARFSALADSDPLAARYAERCAAILAAPEEAGWDGVWNLTEK